MTLIASNLRGHKTTSQAITRMANHFGSIAELARQLQPVWPKTTMCLWPYSPEKKKYVAKKTGPRTVQINSIQQRLSAWENGHASPQIDYAEALTYVYNLIFRI